MAGVSRRSYRPVQLAERLGVSKRTLSRMVDDGRLPKPSRLGPKIIIWDARLIEQWIANGCPRQKGASND